MFHFKVTVSSRFAAPAHSKEGYCDRPCRVSHNIFSLIAFKFRSLSFYCLWPLATAEVKHLMYCTPKIVTLIYYYVTNHLNVSAQATSASKSMTCAHKQLKTKAVENNLV